LEALAIGKKFAKIIVQKINNLLVKLLIIQVSRGKVLLPRKTPSELYEVFENTNQSRYFNNKVLLPYVDINLLNKVNIYKPNEILEVELMASQMEKTFEMKGESKNLVLPLAILDKNGTDGAKPASISISFLGVKQELELKYKNRFHYLPLVADQSIQNFKIGSNNSQLAIGKPIFKDKKLIRNKPKLIVHIFLDAVPQCIIDEFGYKIMPNTKKFFSDGGTFFTNTYAQAEWTLSSIAGVFTGKYTNEHLLYHPRREDKITDTTLADVLKDEGYLTYGCTNVPKLSPLNGFDKGFDRYVSAVDRDCDYIINEACEQLDAFGGNQYLFLGIFDTHEAHILQPISSQVSNDLKDFQFKKLKGNSKNSSTLYDENRINMFKNSITYFDQKLKILYDKIEKYDENALVICHSDHGIDFMCNTNQLLANEREKVVFFYKNNLKNKLDNNVKEIRELPSMVCDHLHIKDQFKYTNDGYAITESIYPQKEYELAVRNNKCVLFFKVPWQDVKKRNDNNYKFSVSYHLSGNEVEELKHDNNCFKMIEVAHKHYLILIQNLATHRVL